MQDIGIGIGVGRPAQLDGPEDSGSVSLTFCGINEAKVVDRDTRIRVTMPAAQAARLWR